MLFSIKSSSSSTSYVNDGVSPSGSGGLKASSNRASLQQLQSYHEVQLSPLDLTALSLLPGDDAIVFACDGTPRAQLSSSDNDNDVTVLKPICIGKAWPSSTLAASSTEKSAKKGKISRQRQQIKKGILPIATIQLFAFL